MATSRNAFGGACVLPLTGPHRGPRCTAQQHRRRSSSASAITLADLNEDITTEPLPEQMVTLLDPSHTRHPNDMNTLCALVEALMHPELYRFIDRNGELFLQPI